ncbi:LOW QUALITY PROTEIN: ubiquitin carboxyl-terminal hydrolase isozyme L3 [Calypte anna]|uniref:LOW QUALITY PROTEIN: ubiquitin carboxyl-terminal hydrolase isozyme L3 n=1 Tax=Calypte anna TaxID=9244 RepID=UPI0011C44B04|nr:LOW QUALITY PROTEIN: ubiquitin carboxyl-terminal hydrolase isozyme L3 [Calypte anna]
MLRLSPPFPHGSVVRSRVRSESRRRRALSVPRCVVQSRTGTGSRPAAVTATTSMEPHRWLPLEANPDVTNQFLKQLGIHPDWQFVDVYGMEPELLSMVPRPVCAVLLLFPITEKYETFRTEEEERIKAKGQDVKSSVYFMKQTINNACGTIGLIHAIANNRDKMNFETNSSLKKFLEDSLSMTPEERAKYLETYEAIRVTHESSAHEGQTEKVMVDDKVKSHFLILLYVGGHLYELDGRKPFPINHGETSDDSFLEDAIEVCRKFMERDPEELRFNAIALSAALKAFSSGDNLLQRIVTIKLLPYVNSTNFDTSLTC